MPGSNALKTLDPGMRRDDENSYAAFLRLAMPTSPSRPEPKSQRAAGTGTTVYSIDSFGLLNAYSSDSSDERKNADERPPWYLFYPHTIIIMSAIEPIRN